MRTLLNCLLVGFILLLCRSGALAQDIWNPDMINPAALGERSNISIGLNAYHQGLGIYGSEKGGLLNVNAPIKYTKGRDPKYLFVGLQIQDKQVNLTNSLTAMAKYAMRFQLGKDLFVSAALSGGVDYKYINFDKMIEDGGNDPILDNLTEHEILFTSKAGVQVHDKDRWGAGVFTGFPYKNTHIGVNAFWRTNTSKKFILELYAYGYYYPQKEKWLGSFYMQCIVGKVLGLGANYSTDNYMQAFASITVKGFQVGYGCGFYDFRTSVYGANTIRHNLFIFLTLGNKRDKDNYNN